MTHRTSYSGIIPVACVAVAMLVGCNQRVDLGPVPNDGAEAIRKASEAARKSMQKVSLHENTIPHETIGEFGGGRVLLRPASPGTGVIAGGGVRAVVEAAGIRDVLAKSLGSSNHANVVKATIEALRNLRRRDEILKVRGIRPHASAPADGGQPS